MRATKVFLQYLKAFPYYVYGFFLAIFHFIQPIESQDYESSSSDVDEFIKYFENKYGVNRPLFANYNYVACVSKAKLTLNFLLIYLHGDDHEESDYFCRETLCNQSFLEFMKSVNVIIWGCNINSGEGFGVSRIIREHSYPFIGLVAINSNNRMYLVARSEGNLTAEQLIDFIRCAIEDNSVGVAICRADREERCNNRILRQEQEEEYAECLRKDQEKDRIERKSLYRKQKKELELEEEAENIKEWRMRQGVVRQLLPCQPSPWSDSNNSNSNNNNTPATHHVMVRIKFPCGSIIQRNFYLTDSIKLLYYVIFSADSCPRDFSVYFNYPRKEIKCKPTHPEWSNQSICRIPRQDLCDPPDFQQTNLTSSTMLYVVDNNA